MRKRKFSKNKICLEGREMSEIARIIATLNRQDPAERSLFLKERSYKHTRRRNPKERNEGEDAASEKVERSRKDLFIRAKTRIRREGERTEGLVPSAVRPCREGDALWGGASRGADPVGCHEVTRK